jgi:uncharacterized protein (DUF1499 family)
MRALIRVIIVLLVLGGATVGALRYFSTTGDAPTNLGLRGDRLAACPETPTCVSSQAGSGDEHYIEPLPLGDAATIHDRLVDAVTGLDALPPEQGFGAERWLRQLQRVAEVQMPTANANYVYATYRLPWVGLIDDLELSVDREAGVVHLRSASRVGNSDLGINRLRVEMLREALAGGE